MLPLLRGREGGHAEGATHLPRMQGTDLGNSRWGTWKHSTSPFLVLSLESHRVTRGSGLTLDEDQKAQEMWVFRCQESKNIPCSLEKAFLGRSSKEINPNTEASLNIKTSDVASLMLLKQENPNSPL